MSKNGLPSEIIMHVDISIPLWAFFDLSGKHKVCLVGTVLPSTMNDRDISGKIFFLSIFEFMNGSVNFDFFYILGLRLGQIRRDPGNRVNLLLPNNNTYGGWAVNSQSSAQTTTTPTQPMPVDSNTIPTAPVLVLARDRNSNDVVAQPQPSSTNTSVLIENNANINVSLFLFILRREIL